MKEFSKIGDYHVKDAVARLEIEEVKETLNNLPTASGSLPEVTTADNGKFLRVVDGVWVAEAVSTAETTEF